MWFTTLADTHIRPIDNTPAVITPVISQLLTRSVNLQLTWLVHRIPSRGFITLSAVVSLFCRFRQPVNFVAAVLPSRLRGPSKVCRCSWVLPSCLVVAHAAPRHAALACLCYQHFRITHVPQHCWISRFTTRIHVEISVEKWSCQWGNTAGCPPITHRIADTHAETLVKTWFDRSTHSEVVRPKQINTRHPFGDTWFWNILLDHTRRLQNDDRGALSGRVMGTDRPGDQHAEFGKVTAREGRSTRGWTNAQTRGINRWVKTDKLKYPGMTLAD